MVEKDTQEIGLVKNQMTGKNLMVTGKIKMTLMKIGEIGKSIMTMMTTGKTKATKDSVSLEK
jgi:ribosomal protein L17